MSRHARLALCASLALVWLNFLLTTRWAHIDGSLHGWRRPYFLAILGATTLLAFLTRRRDAVTLGPTALRLIWSAAALLLAGAFLQWFPPATWTRIPFIDNWPPRFQSTADGVSLLQRGVVNGWEWGFLGGYHTSSDVTQNLSVLGFIPMSLLGPELGFHILQLLLFVAVPVMLYLDLKEDSGRDVALLSSAIALLASGCFSYIFIRSGDTNSVAGLACTALTLLGSHAARRGAQYGWPLLVTGFVLTGYSHIGFFGYAVLFVVLDALYSRDAATLRRGVTAAGIAVLVTLPATWELLRYPDYFNFNNVVYERGSTIEGPSIARRIYYNVELLFLPGRWVNDYTGLALVFLPVIVMVAWSARRQRVGFYAAAVVVTELLMRLNLPQFGYVFMRPSHLLVMFTPPALAWFILKESRSRGVALSLVVLTSLYLQITFPRVPHVNNLDDVNRALLDRIRSADGELVLVENNPHRDMDADPVTTSEPTPFGVHWEARLYAETGRRFYAGFWDGWQWSPWRGQTLAGGTLFGQQVGLIPAVRFEHEMRRWDVRRLFVWSDVSVAYLDGLSEFERTWTDGRWHEFRFAQSVSRGDALVDSIGRLEDLTPLGATIIANVAAAGAEVVVRMNHFPAWELWSGGVRVPLFARDGQLAFKAPAQGAQRLELVYPRRRWLSMLALTVWGLALLWPLRRGRTRVSAG